MMRLERYAPPGFNWQRELKWICTGIVAAVLYSMGFIIKCLSAADALYWRTGGARTLIDGILMSDFHVIADGCFTVFWVVALCLVATVVLHYAYHYQGAKSIYLMRRLPDRRELHIRCLAIPLTAMLACLALTALLLVIYYLIYLAMTPDVCQTPDQWSKLFSAWMGV